MTAPWKKIVAVLSLIVLTGQGCTKAPDQATVAASQRIALNVWGVIDDVDVYQPVLTDYRAAHPNITINFRRLRLAEYEQALVDALAEDRGPDIFLIHNDWMGKYVPKIFPMPASTQIAYAIASGGLQQQQTWQLQTESTIPVKDFKSQFADAVIKDAVRTINVSTDADHPKLEPHVLAIPVSLDTLALYYNKDLLNAAGIPNPPENWGQFQEQVKKLTKLDAQGRILQAGAGIGTAYNVERAADIISALMIQNGQQMTDENGHPVFQYIPSSLSGTREAPPSYQALQFYTDFANPDKETYTWNAAQPNSLEAFIAGRSAFFLGYSYHLAEIRARAPKLNLGISKLPQIEGNPVKNYANYWMWTVSKKTKNSDIAWNLLNFLAKPEETKKVLDKSKGPAARKSLLTDQLNDEDVGVFASQVLTAESWYRGNDPQATGVAFQQMINDVVTGAAPINDAIKIAQDKVEQTMR